MTLFRAGACWRLIAVALWFSACGGSSEDEGNAVGTGGSAMGGSSTATGGSGSSTATGGSAIGGATIGRGGSATGGSRAGATATGGAPTTEAAGAGGAFEADAGAGGTDDSVPPSGGVTGGSFAAGGSGGDCEPLAPVEGTVFDGDLYLTTPEEVEGAQQYSEITGSLQVLAILEPLDVELPRLRRLGGDLSADSTKLRRLLAPRLEGIDGKLWLYLNHEMVEIDLRNLTQVGADVFIHRNLTLRVLQLDALVSEGGVTGVVINGNLELPDCFLDVLDQRFGLARTTAPECTCTRGCGLIQADCP